jgi:hypothetical protein
MTSETPNASSSDRLIAQLRAAGLTGIPDFSATVLADLSEDDPGLHASALLEAPPEDLTGWASLLIERDNDAALCGFVGYGIQSRFFLLYWRQGPMVVLLRVAFGALEGEAASARRASGGVGLANALTREAGTIDRTGRWPSGRLLLAVSDAIGESGWCWVEAGAPVARLALDTSMDIAGAFAALDALDPDAGDGDEQ